MKHFLIGALLSLAAWARPASAGELFLYQDARGDKGAFVRLGGKSWAEHTGGGGRFPFREVSRAGGHIELFDPGRGGVGVRLSANDSAWRHPTLTKGEWRPLWRGSFVQSADLREELNRLGLKARVQGARGTCSVFATAGALELALSRRRGRAAPLSVEFMNWASNKVGGDLDDGSFFHTCLDGFRRYGACLEQDLPYRERYDKDLRPPAAALKVAAAVRREMADMQVHWILPPGNTDPGLTGEQFAEVKATLARGHPVAFGSGHSILLVGFQEDAARPGGGYFHVRDSNLDRFTTYTFEHVRTKPYDIFWVELRKLPPSRRTTWRYAGGEFKQTGKGRWTELCKDGSSYHFREAARHADYVELYEDRRRLTLRIYGRSYSRMQYKLPGMRRWAVMYHGEWVG